MSFLQTSIPATTGPEYDFLRTDPHLVDNICLLTYGGSHAYGTNIEGSDMDIRGIALNSAEEILPLADMGITDIGARQCSSLQTAIRISLNCWDAESICISMKLEIHWSRMRTCFSRNAAYTHSAAMPTHSCAGSRTARCTISHRKKESDISRGALSTKDKDAQTYSAKYKPNK